MKNLIFLSFILIGGILFALDSRKYLDKVVFVNTWDGIGSGVVIGDYYVLTCFHLDHEFFVQGIPATIIREHPLFDLVYLKTKQKFQQKAELAKVVVLGEKVYIVGYANGAKCFLEGIVSRIDRGVLWIDAKVVKGLSGGGVFNENGELVGLVNGGYGYPDMFLIAVDFTTIKKFLDLEEKEEKEDDFLIE